MAAARWTDYAKRPRAARTADHLHIVSIYDLPAGKAVASFVEGAPGAMTIEVSQNLQFVRVGELDWTEERHRVAGSQLISGATIRRTANSRIGQSLMAHLSHRASALRRRSILHFAEQTDIQSK